MAVAAVTVAFVLIGFLVGRWPVILLAFLWILVYVAQTRGWWGDEVETGEFSELFLGVVIAYSCLAFAIGVAVRKIVRRSRNAS